jgi:hypothetical protein
LRAGNVEGIVPILRKKRQNEEDKHQNNGGADNKGYLRKRSLAGLGRHRFHIERVQSWQTYIPVVIIHDTLFNPRSFLMPGVPSSNEPIRCS